MCRRQAARSGEAVQKLADSILSINYRPGPGAAAVKENPSRRGRLWDSFIELRLHEKEDKFRLRFEMSISNSEVMQADLRTRPSPVSFKLFADAGVAPRMILCWTVCPDSPLAASVPGRPALWDTSSEAAYSFLSRCISEYELDHTCKQTLSDISFPCKPPRRLIKIDDGDAGLHLKLIQTSSLAEFPRYCALSYRWDNPARHAQKETLRSTLGTYESVINPTGLPRTVADAVACCRRLGLPHLWVDALCVVQNDDDDKLSEIAAMGDIYANAYLTLTPSIAGGSDDGFLAPRENPFLSAPIPDIRSGGAPVGVKLAPSSRGLLNPSTLVQLKGQRPKPAKSYELLHSRGWTF
ncbi:HET domain-containing protein [Colletotrichum higginsianum IMI 349063]|nr:HET domain-containing protein [Colletotrichum higginsianum IMI 349063]OBR13106.1 HET domain-containing protein [Colletotrichum higginsianum IMI 349063]GJC96221.1 HET domain-containing protein [Colletotrichum higginsianum]